MNVPLEWLADYVKLPPTKKLTDRLTMIGHLLDKEKEVNGEKVIDLELRGNRADLFGMYGIARDVSAAFEIPLVVPPVATLPETEAGSKLVTIEKDARGLVKRFCAVKLKVKIKPSPAWMVKRLEAYGMPAINNVIDITNYVMLETGEPMHAFDVKLLKGGRLILRRARDGEVFQTIQQGTTVKLTHNDLAICDEEGPQTLTMIGGLLTGVNEKTEEVLLEAAVYDQGNCRRSARRLKIFTEGGLRHEKNLDPQGVEWALQRAVYLLMELAEASTSSLVSDYFPEVSEAKRIRFDLTEVARLGGIEVPEKVVTKILKDLGFEIEANKGVLTVTVPTFRTDVEGSADLVEEVLRINGYEKIPTTPLSDTIPEPMNYPSYEIQERLRDILSKLGLNEVVTLSMVSEDLAPDGISLVNPPDPNFGKLRTKISPSLVVYADKLADLNQQRVAIFEIGKVFGAAKVKPAKKGARGYAEGLHLGIAMTGKTEEKNWNNSPRDLNIYDLKGVIERAKILLGVKKVAVEMGVKDKIFWAEIEVDVLIKNFPSFSLLYSVVSGYPPIIEDINIILSREMSYESLVEKMKKVSPLVSSVVLVDKYGEKLTLKVSYHSSEKQLSSEDVEPIRKKLLLLGR